VNCFERDEIGRPLVQVSSAGVEWRWFLELSRPRVHFSANVDSKWLLALLFCDHLVIIFY
jgi:hypothetical protein